MKKISILGSTGSIGSQALQIIDENPDKYKVCALSGASRLNKLAEQIKNYRPEYAVVADRVNADKFQAEFPETKILSGKEGLNYISSQIECDLVLNSLVGMMGLEPTYNAIQAGRDIALANKETLVAGGELIIQAVRDNDVALLPVDSEHSAVFQCMEGYDEAQVRKIILTASGGPFRGKTLKELGSVTLEEALNHPKWTMGSKITIDSATLMNKGLEVIEARWLFDLPAEKIDVIVHPQSIIHSMVEYEDHAIMAQLGYPDMKIPISFAFEYPYRLKNDLKPLNFAEIKELTFEAPDYGTFKCLRLAYDAIRQGGSYPVALNAANEVLVGMFLKNRIKFLDIQDNIEKILVNHKPEYNLSLEDVLRIDSATRRVTEELMSR